MTLLLNRGDYRLRPDPLLMFFLFILAIQGVGAALNLTPPGSVASQLPRLLLLIWGVALAAGSIIAFAGNILLLFRRFRIGLPAIQLGLALTGLAVLYYAVCVFVYAPRTGSMAGVLSVILSAVCYASWRRIDIIIRDAEIYAAAKEVRGAIDAD